MLGMSMGLLGMVADGHGLAWIGRVQPWACMECSYPAAMVLLAYPWVLLDKAVRGHGCCRAMDMGFAGLIWN